MAGATPLARSGQTLPSGALFTSDRAAAYGYGRGLGYKTRSTYRRVITPFAFSGEILVVEADEDLELLEGHLGDLRAGVHDVCQSLFDVVRANRLHGLMIPDFCPPAHLRAASQVVHLNVEANLVCDPLGDPYEFLVEPI